MLLRLGDEVPLIPRYFDLLLLLIERRHEAVHRREIFDRVWKDETVSDSALSQAIRTIRRTLGDDSKEPRFIRTVSRHGYRFVLADVIEEDDDDSPVSRVAVPIALPVAPASDRHWWDAARGGALAGMAAGGLGGLILSAAPGSAAPLAIAPVLAVIGGACGAIGGIGVGAGVSIAEARGQSERPATLIAAAALGGGVVGVVVQWLARWSLASLLGLEVAVGGGLEGVAIGAAAGVGYVLAARSSSLRRQVLVTAVLCGLAGVALTLGGRPLVGGTIHVIAMATDGSRATLEPLGRLIGEPDFGPVTRVLIAFGEGATFGLGVAFGLLRRRE